MNYVCPSCASYLQWDINSPHSHSCSACDTVVTDERYYAMWLFTTNLKQVEFVQNAVVLACIPNPDQEQAIQYTQDFFRHYSETYADMIEHGERVGSGKLQSQSLGEAVWMIQAATAWRQAQAAQLISEAEASSIAKLLFAPAIDVIQRQTFSTNNIHTWQAAALVALGHAVGNQEAVGYGATCYPQCLRKKRSYWRHVV